MINTITEQNESINRRIELLVKYPIYALPDGTLSASDSRLLEALSIIADLRKALGVEWEWEEKIYQVENDEQRQAATTRQRVLMNSSIPG